MNSMDEVAQHMRSKRVGKKTKGNYSGKLNTIKVFLLSNGYQEYVTNDGQVNIPLSDDIIQRLFGWLSVNTDLPKKARRQRVTEVDSDSDDEDEEEEDGDDDEVEETPDIFAERQITISPSCMQGYKSALIWLYLEKDHPWPPDIDSWVQTFIRGYKKTVAEKKATGVMSLKEGKSNLAFTGYNAICKEFMERTPSGRKHSWAQGIFGWAFMTLSWNLMARSDSVRKIMLQHVDWKNDCMTITFAKHKGDLTGEGLGNEKHVYANPLNPKICPILALAVLIFTSHRGSQVNEQTLFAGIRRYSPAPCLSNVNFVSP